MHGRIHLRSRASISSIWNLPQASLTPPSILFRNPFSTDSSRSSLNLIIPSPSSHPGRKSSGRLPLFGPLFFYAATILPSFCGGPQVPAHETPGCPSPFTRFLQGPHLWLFPSTDVPLCGSLFGFSFPHFLITKIIHEYMLLVKDANKTQVKGGRK